MQLKASGSGEDSKMDPVQKAVINHTFGVPLVKTKRPIISCNVCQIRFNSESQAEAHYKGNRHARRVKGIETSKSRPQEGDKPSPGPTSSPSPPGPVASAPDSDPSKAGAGTKWPRLLVSVWSDLEPGRGLESSHSSPEARARRQDQGGPGHGPQNRWAVPARPGLGAPGQRPIVFRGFPSYQLHNKSFHGAPPLPRGTEQLHSHLALAPRPGSLPTVWKA
ncbi:hypothetical protein ACEWY4_000962 [Coilia grayii]|uniref:C2H2-type domain-containing protein n=1 Tax=Coilia grayii TaxID=363190 RepID=A0ABD1KY51_9TELE